MFQALVDVEAAFGLEGFATVRADDALTLRIRVLPGAVPEQADLGVERGVTDITGVALLMDLLPFLFTVWTDIILMVERFTALRALDPFTLLTCDPVDVVHRPRERDEHDHEQHEQEPLLVHPLPVDVGIIHDEQRHQELDHKEQFLRRQHGPQLPQTAYKSGEHRPPRFKVLRPVCCTMDTPVLIVNFKTYEAASGDSARELAYDCEKVAAQEDEAVAVAVQDTDIDRISDRVEIPVLAQHADPEDYGSNTGSDIVETLAYNGANGIIINHSEDQVPLDTIRRVIEKCDDHDLISVVCVDDPNLAETVADDGPDFIAYEPPELIGGDTSVSSAKPEVLEEVVDRVGRKSTVLTGAGVKTTADVEKSLELGSQGVLVASGVVKADDPREAAKGLVDGFR